MSWGRVLTCLVVLLGSTMGYHTISHGESVPSRQPLSSFPKQLEQWKGEDIAIDPQVVNVLKADDLLLRVYQSPGNPPIWLYIAYFNSQRQGQTIHSPRNCLPGNGWEPVESGRKLLAVSRRRRIRLNRYVVENGSDRQLVFYWYQSHGRTVASEYLAKMYMVRDAIEMNRTDGALIRVSVPIGGNEEAAEQLAQGFVRQIYPLLGAYIPR